MKRLESLIPIELLAPARNAEYGRAAINHGADAVYIGASQFGARSAVGNSLEDIRQLIRFAHLYNARVYATLNTILYDHELEDAQTLIHQLYESEIDGIIIQDMGILELNLPPVQLIASTQTHNQSLEKIQFLEKVGFSRIILARELSLEDIKSIRKETSVELESFVHGALCVSYSGQCYMSQSICNRSGNRGMCAQPCRSEYTLTDNNGTILEKDKHLLSLKDLQLTNSLEGMLNAGITSFKIEGRLKDIAYVKNIVAHYRQELDKVLLNNNNFGRSSSGKSFIPFIPDPDKTFNRGYTTLMMEGRKDKLSSLETQKSLGKKAGRVVEMGSNWFRLAGEQLANGDGICFIKQDGLGGTHVNRVEGDKIFPRNAGGIHVGMEIYRNHDHEFEKELDNSNQLRKIAVNMLFEESETGFRLKLSDEDQILVEVLLDSEIIPAEKPENARQVIIQQLEKLGDSIFYCNEIEVNLKNVPYLKASQINQLRRLAVEKLEEARLQHYEVPGSKPRSLDVLFPSKCLNYQGNVSNKLAQNFYKKHGVENIDPAFEIAGGKTEVVVMTTKHCIRYQFDACPVHQKSNLKLNEPLYLNDQHHRYRLEFDCKQCQMKVILL